MLVWLHLLQPFIACSLMVTTVLLDDLKQLNDKLVEVSTSKLALQMKVDELEAVQVNIKVSDIVCLFCFFNRSNNFLGQTCLCRK